MIEDLEVRGIGVDNPNGPPRKQIFVRRTTTGFYYTHSFPDSLPFNRGQISKFLGNLYNTPPGSIIWPDHVKVPEV